MFVACGIWCLADVSSVSPSSEQSEQSAPTKGSSRWDGKYPGFSVSPKNQGRKFRIYPKLHRFKLRLVCR